MNVYYSDIAYAIDAVFIVTASNKEEAAEKILAKIQFEGYELDITDIKPIKYNGKSLVIFHN